MNMHVQKNLTVGFNVMKSLQRIVNLQIITYKNQNNIIQRNHSVLSKHEPTKLTWFVGSCLPMVHCWFTCCWFIVGSCESTSTGNYHKAGKR